MPYVTTTATRKVAQMTARIRAVPGGCLAKGTKILMYDLTYKNVEDISVGDLLMGIDSTSRKVLKLYRGTSMMYKVEQTKGNDYVVNDKHILVTEFQGKDLYKMIKGKKTYIGREHKNGFFKMTAEDFYKGSQKSTEKRYKGIKGSVNFKKKKIHLDPYLLGLWLGDGHSRTPSITNIDKEIIDYLYDEIPKMYSVFIRHANLTYHLSKKNTGKYNEVTQKLKKYNLILNKHIPIEYIRNDRKTRLMLLAGLIDSDGCLARDSKTKQSKGYYIVQKNRKLAENILLLCRTLGFYCTFKPRMSTMKRKDGTVYSCETYTVAIFPKDYNEIPVKVERKKCKMINYKNVLRSSLKVNPIGKGKYYGFELDKDHMFMLEDFTITHNTSASKSISILLILIHLAQTDKKPTLTSIVSESLPHLKKGVIRDFLLIMNEHTYYDDERWNRTDFTYTFESGSQIEFFSVDQPDKVRGPRRERLWVNEANNVHFDAFDQLLVRTKQFAYLDWNPTNEFWYYTDVKPLRTDWEEVTLTYLDNEALDPAIVADIEQRKGNKGWWKVYGEGKLGEVDGKIYKDWAIIDEIPHEAKLLRYGVDFGYTDPTAVVAIYEHMGGYIIEELMFQKEATNSQIASLLLNKPKALIVADSADPKSIADLQSHGLTVIGSEKGRDSVANGISNLQEQRISVTRNSNNVIKEYRNYLWITDKNGKILPEPEHAYSHSMDSCRYSIMSILKRGNGATPKVSFSTQNRYGPKKYTKFNIQ